MCNRNLIGGLILAAEALLVVAALMLAIAIIEAGSIFTALASIGQTLATAAIVGVALGLMIGARSAAAGCASGTCASQGTALLTALNVTIGMLTGLLAALLLSLVSVGTGGTACLVLMITTGGSLIYLATRIVPLELCAGGAGAPSSPLFALAATMAWIAGGLLIVAAIIGVVLTIMAAASG